MLTPERLDLARELHDGIAQDLVALGYSLDLLLSDGSLSKSTRIEIRQSRLQVDELMQKVRAEIYKLRIETHQTLKEELAKLLKTEFTDINVEFEYEEVNSSSEMIREITAIVRESLRNIRAHARATQVAIDVYPLNNRICLQICDDGIGGVNLKSKHWGIIGITERVKALGGSISIEDGFSNKSGVRLTILL